jgi:hypothetical protein
MSAGDVKFIGWTGSASTFTELEPTLTYEPVQATGEVNTINKRITRRLICFSAYKQTIISGLSILNASITSNYIDTNGAIQSADYGGGWKLLTLDEAQYKPGYTILTINYIKTVARVFEMGLPALVTVTCSAGTAAIRYNNSIREQFASNTGACGAGLVIKWERMPGLFSKTAATQNEAQWFLFWLEVNGVRFGQRYILGKELRQRQNNQVIKTIAGPFAEARTTAELAALKTSSGAAACTNRVVYTTHRIAESATVDLPAYYVSGDGVSEVQYGTNYAIEFVKVPQYYVDAVYFEDAPLARYAIDLVPEVRWVNQPSRFRLVIEGKPAGAVDTGYIIWKDYSKT